MKTILILFTILVFVSCLMMFYTIRNRYLIENTLGYNIEETEDAIALKKRISDFAGVNFNVAYLNLIQNGIITIGKAETTEIVNIDMIQAMLPTDKMVTHIEMLFKYTNLTNPQNYKYEILNNESTIGIGKPLKDINFLKIPKIINQIKNKIADSLSFAYIEYYQIETVLGGEFHTIDLIALNKNNNQKVRLAFEVDAVSGKINQVKSAFGEYNND